MTKTRIWPSLALTVSMITLLCVALSIPSHDLAHADETTATTSQEPHPQTPEGDSTNADYWRYCSIDGFLASKCGGTVTSCPPGTMMSRVTWIGTCRNPADGKDYIVSYNDCCGKGPCGGDFVHRNEGDKPVYYAHKSNDVSWCMGEADAAYNSTVSIVIGVASEPDH